MNKTMFWIGIALIAIASLLFLGVFGDMGMSPVVLGVIGIVMGGASGYRPMERKKI